MCFPFSFQGTIRRINKQIAFAPKCSVISVNLRWNRFQYPKYRHMRKQTFTSQEVRVQIYAVVFKAWSGQWFNAAVACKFSYGGNHGLWRYRDLESIFVSERFFTALIESGSDSGSETCAGHEWTACFVVQFDDLLVVKCSAEQIFLVPMVMSQALGW